MIRLRFVSSNDLTSEIISFAEQFWASHVEAVMPDGSGYLGAHADGGVQLRPVGYDKATLKREEFVDLPCSDEIADKFYEGLRKHIGEDYDFSAILGIALRIGMHLKGHAICSALQVAELIASTWFKWKLGKEPYEISPGDLFLILSSHVDLTYAI